MAEHTPTPWMVDDDGDTLYIWAESVKDYVAKLTDFGWPGPLRANADFIVKAVNNHDALVAALQIVANDSYLDEFQLEYKPTPLALLARKALSAVVGQMKDR